MFLIACMPVSRQKKSRPKTSEMFSNYGEINGGKLCPAFFMSQSTHEKRAKKQSNVP